MKVWFKSQDFDSRTIFLVRSSECTAMRPSTWASTHVCVLHWRACFRATHIIFLPRGQNYWQRQSFPVSAPVSSPSATKQFPLTLTSLIFSTKLPYFKDQNFDHWQRASLCVLARDAKGTFSALLTAPTRTHICWYPQSGKHSPLQRWVWHLRLLHDMQAQHFIRHGDFSWASSAKASHCQAYYIRKCIKVSKLFLSTIRSSAKKGISEK